jgi:hypothetical protein
MLKNRTPLTTNVKATTAKATNAETGKTETGNTKIIGASAQNSDKKGGIKKR